MIFALWTRDRIFTVSAVWLSVVEIVATVSVEGLIWQQEYRRSVSPGQFSGHFPRRVSHCSDRVGVRETAVVKNYLKENYIMCISFKSKNVI